MEWKKAGGQLLDEEKKRQVQQERSRSQRPARGAVGGTPEGVDPFPDRSVDDLAQAAWSLLSRLFR
jgi:hypothetical protein